MDITSILKTVAPWIGTALGGPLGSLAASAACEALGVDEKTTDGLKNALAGVTQEDLLKLKKAEQDFVYQMRSLGIKELADLEAIAAGDRKDARAMQTATRSNVPALLTMFLTVGTVAIIAALIFKGGLPDTGVANLVLGQYIAAWVTSIAFWFGTTAHSESKTDIIARSPAVGGK